MKKQDQISLGVELESEVKSDHSLSTTRGRITFTERSIYLGTGKNRRILYDGKSIDFCLKYKGKVEFLPKVAELGEMYYCTSNKSFCIRKTLFEWEILPIGAISPQELDNLVNLNTNQIIKGKKTFENQVDIVKEPTEPTHLVRLVDLEKKLESIPNVMRLIDTLGFVSQLDLIDNPKEGDCYHIGETKSFYVRTRIGTWENLGSQLVDLTQFYSKTEVDNLIRIGKSEHYTKTETDEKLRANKTEVTEVLKEEIKNNSTTLTETLREEIKTEVKTEIKQDIENNTIVVNTVELKNIQAVYVDDRNNIDIRKQGFRFRLNKGAFPLKVTDTSGMEVFVQTYFEQECWNIVTDEYTTNHLVVCLENKTK